MDRLRNWMHGKGRPVVIIIMCLLALWMIVDYYMDTHQKKTQEKESPAVISAPDREDDIVTTQEDVGSGAEAGRESDDSDAEEESESDDGTVTLGFAGDINLDERWAIMQHMRHKGKGISGCIDPKLIRYMRQDDYMILNNEFSFSNRGSAMKGKTYTFRAPKKNVKILKQLGVDAVSLANNHTYDYGKTAFFDTMSVLKRAGIKYTGAGKNIKEAKKPVYLHCKGKTIAVVAATRAEKNVMTPGAGKKSPGVFRTYNDRAYVRAIRRAKKKADCVIAFVHWGTEYSTVLEAAQKQQAKDYINAGADVVVGAHTHCLQGVGYYKGKPIFYSLGNYWFNSRKLYTTLLQLKIKPNGKLEARMLPCRQSGCETKLLTGKREVRKFVRHVNRISTNARLGAKGLVKKKR